MHPHANINVNNIFKLFELANLQKINFSKNSFVDDDLVFKMCTNCKELKSLNINGKIYNINICEMKQLHQ